MDFRKDSGYMHLTPISSLLPRYTHAPTTDPRAVAQEFESLFISMVMRSMRKTVPNSSLVPRSLGEKIYTDMLDTEYSGMISRHESLGLADLIQNELEQHRSTPENLNSLQQLKNPAWMIDNRMVSRHAGVRFSRSLRSRIAAWNNHIKSAAQKFDIDPHLIRAVIAQESAGNPHAVSHAGAKGLMQLIDSTAAEMRVNNVFDPHQNIQGGSRYLQRMLRKYKGDVRLALAAYNAGPAAVDRYKGIPPYRETQNYVESVLRLRQDFASVTESRVQQEVAHE
ncbi:MAG: transglycosylase SLT domain-containing protein [Chitinivibrionales bacterium]|nr:transglycosylase SLT domain-containing protein [Chitinivibrionales bacterium]